MDTLQVLNSREVKKIVKMLKEQWDYSGTLDYVFYQNSESKLFISNREAGEFDKSSLRLNSIGLYFGEIVHDGIRLSIDGSQLIGPHASRNVVKLNESEAREWLAGHELATEASDGFVIVQHEQDFMGCGKAVRGKLLNYVPKARRIN